MLQVKDWVNKKNAQFEVIQTDSEGISVAKRLTDGRIFERNKDYETYYREGIYRGYLTFTKFFDDQIMVQYKISSFHGPDYEPEESNNDLEVAQINHLTHRIQSYPAPIPESEWFRNMEE